MREPYLAMHRTVQVWTSRHFKWALYVAAVMALCRVLAGLTCISQAMNTVEVVLYMTPVSHHHGPFRYVSGSHR